MKFVYIFIFTIYLVSCGTSQKPLDQVYNSEIAIEQLESIEKAKILTEEELINLSVYISCSTDEQLSGQTYAEIFEKAKKIDTNELLNSMSIDSDLYNQRLSQDTTSTDTTKQNK